MKNHKKLRNTAPSVNTDTVSLYATHTFESGFLGQQTKKKISDFRKVLSYYLI